MGQSDYIVGQFGKPLDADYEKTAAPICMNAPQLLHKSSATVGHPSDSWAS